MSKTKITITFLIVLLALAGVGLVACLLMGGSQSSNTGKENKEKSLMMEILAVPVIYIEAKVVSLSDDPPEKICNDGCIYSVHDTGVLQIIKVITVRHPFPDEFRINAEDLIDARVKVDFRYSHRPAKIEYILVTSPPESESSSEGFPATSPPKHSVRMEGGYLVYTIETKSPNQVDEILPGVKEGSVIRAEIEFFDLSKGIISKSRGIISRYELVH